MSIRPAAPHLARCLLVQAAHRDAVTYGGDAPSGLDSRCLNATGWKGRESRSPSSTCALRADRGSHRIARLVPDEVSATACSSPGRRARPIPELAPRAANAPTSSAMSSVTFGRTQTLAFPAVISRRNPNKEVQTHSGASPISGRRIGYRQSSGKRCWSSSASRAALLRH
jgi:hypothetical protein